MGSVGGYRFWRILLGTDWDFSFPVPRPSLYTLFFPMEERKADSISKIILYIDTPPMKTR